MPSATAPSPPPVGKQSVKIPIIDISPANKHAAKELLSAAAEFGFVYVENNAATSVLPADIAGMFDLSKEFFQSPREVKETCSINSNKSGKNRGWLSMHTETLDPKNQKRGDFKEAFNMGEVLDNKITQPLPEPLSSHSQQLIDFQTSCHDLCNRVLDLFATALGIEESWFSSRHDKRKGASGSILRLLYYPAVSHASLAPNEDDVRAGAHSDYGSVTLLFQLPGQPGLEILTPEGVWASVPVDPANTLSSEDPSRPLPILVNIGDLLDYWTNGLLKSTVHRVIFPKEEEKAREGDEQKRGGDRYSIAYFCHPLDDAKLVAVPSELVRGKGEDKNEAEDKGVLTARDHLNSRLEATYGIKP